MLTTTLHQPAAESRPANGPTLVECTARKLARMKALVERRQQVRADHRDATAAVRAELKTIESELDQLAHQDDAQFEFVF